MHKTIIEVQSDARSKCKLIYNKYMLFPKTLHSTSTTTENYTLLIYHLINNKHHVKFEITFSNCIKHLDRTTDIERLYKLETNVI